MIIHRSLGWTCFSILTACLYNTRRGRVHVVLLTTTITRLARLVTCCQNRKTCTVHVLEVDLQLCKPSMAPCHVVKRYYCFVISHLSFLRNSCFYLKHNHIGVQHEQFSLHCVSVVFITFANIVGLGG